MLTTTAEKIVEPVVEKFVIDLEGNYEAHCSDAFLTALIIDRLNSQSRRLTHLTVADEIVLFGDRDAAYYAVRWLFEGVLEHKCRANGNGHLMAQQFADAMVAAAYKGGTEE